MGYIYKNDLTAIIEEYGTNLEVVIDYYEYKPRKRITIGEFMEMDIEDRNIRRVFLPSDVYRELFKKN
jgi:hypothetical protein